MRACLCWNCGKLCECWKSFSDGRPKKRAECADYIDAPPEPIRITHLEIAEMLGCPIEKIDRLATNKRGIRCLERAFARKGIVLTYERTKNKTLFYREEIKNEG